MSTKRHHYLPQFYLAHFLLPGKKTLVVYDKMGLPPREQPPINTGVESRLFTVLEPSGEMNDTIETEIFSPLDGAVAPILARWIAGLRPAAGERATVAAFLASLYVRVPRQIAFTQEAVVLAMLKINRDLASDPTAFANMIRQYNESNPHGAILDVEAARQMMLHMEDDCRVTVDRQFGMVQSIGLLGDVAEALLDLKWIILRAGPDQAFVVGDSPVSILVLHPDGRASFGAGVAHPLVEVAFPLNPGQCLYMRRVHSPLLPTTRELNRRMIAQADRFVVAPDYSDDIEGLVKDFAFTMDLPYLDRNEVERGLADATESES